MTDERSDHASTKAGSQNTETSPVSPKFAIPITECSWKPTENSVSKTLISPSGQTSPLLGRNSQQVTSRVAAVAPHHPAQLGNARRTPRPEASMIVVHLVQHLSGRVPRMNLGQIVPVAEHRVRTAKPHHYHPQPIPKQPRRHSTIIVQTPYSIRRFPLLLPVKLTPHKHRQNHALNRVQTIRRKLIRQQRKRPHLPPTLKPRYRYPTLPIRKQLYRSPVVRLDLPKTTSAPAQRTLLARYRPKVDFSICKRISVFEDR